MDLFFNLTDLSLHDAVEFSVLLFTFFRFEHVFLDVGDFCMSVINGLQIPCDAYGPAVLGPGGRQLGVFDRRTDVDCILDKEALYRIIWPTMNTGIRVIAVSATMRMSNGCKVVNGQMREVRPPHNLIPLFQDLEYARSFYIGKTALSTFNALQNVSGGFGLFDTDVAIKAGGYDGDSFAEDMDMIARMIRYMCDSGESYRIVQIPEICCWTEGPSNLKILSRQRTRWGRGLLQMFQVHRDMVFNPAYRQYGLFTLPYIMVFELFAPLIEFTGYLMILWLFLIQAINYHTIWIVFLSLYSFAQFLSLTIITIDNYVAHGFKKQRDYLWLFLASLLEPFLYHPLNVFFSSVMTEPPFISEPVPAIVRMQPIGRIFWPSSGFSCFNQNFSQ